MRKPLEIVGGAQESTTWAVMNLFYGSLIPKYPTTDLVKPAIIPRSPLIELVDDATKHVPYLWELYKTGCRPPSNATSAQAMKDRKVMVGNAAALFAMHEIPPAAWIAFSRSLWPVARMTWNGPEHPTAQWMFSPRRIQDQREWFVSEQHDWCGPRVRFGPASLALSQTWSSMKLNLVRAHPEKEHELVQIVERYFPGSMYQSQIAHAVKEHQEMQQRIDTAIARGVFMWE